MYPRCAQITRRTPLKHWLEDCNAIASVVDDRSGALLMMTSSLSDDLAQRWMGPEAINKWTRKRQFQVSKVPSRSNSQGRASQPAPPLNSRTCKPAVSTFLMSQA